MKNIFIVHRCLMCGECCKKSRVHMTEEEFKKVPKRFHFLFHKVYVKNKDVTLYKVKVRDTETGELVAWNSFLEVMDDKYVCGALMDDGKCFLHPYKPQICKDIWCKKSEISIFKLILEKLRRAKRWIKRKKIG